MIQRATNLDLESYFDVSKLDVWDAFDLPLRAIKLIHN